MIKCLICGKEFYSITGKHLKKHGTTLGQYRYYYSRNLESPEKSEKKKHYKKRFDRGLNGSN